MSDGGVINEKRQKKHDAHFVVPLLLVMGITLVQKYQLDQVGQDNYF